MPQEAVREAWRANSGTRQAWTLRLKGKGHHLKDSRIEWTHHTFSPWWGCEKVSRGCQHCYAEAWAKRTGHDVWGSGSPRRFFGDKHWREPLKWNTEAKAAGERRRVFCASMADVFEDRLDLNPQRERLFRLIEETQDLDWLVLTKRPENMRKLVPGHWKGGWPVNVWAGTTIESNATRERWAHLKQVPASVRFISAEPLVEDVDFSTIIGVEYSDIIGDWLPEQIHVLGGHPSPDWIIVGGESGGGASSFNPDWARKIRDQCAAGKVSFFMKQLGTNVEDRNDAGFDGDEPGSWPMGTTWIEDRNYDGFQGDPVRVKLRDAKGGDPAEWPEDLRVRQFPSCQNPNQG